MSYFIVNGGVTKIGGGSLGRTEELPTLKLLCVDLCARHLDRLSNLGDMPTEVFLDLLKRAKGKATPEVVQRLQDQNERLLCEEVDLAFWKQAVEDHILRRTVPAPGPILVERVHDYKQRLANLQAADTSPSKNLSGDILAVLKALDELPASVGMLRETMIAKAVAPLRKDNDPHVARRANEIVRRWKEAARARGPEESEQDKTAALLFGKPGLNNGSGSGSNSSGSNGSGDRSGRGKGSGGGGDVKRTPAEEKQRTIEEGFRCRDWYSLYQHLEQLRGDKVRASSKRAREAREREQQKRPKMIVGKSRSEDFKTRRRHGKHGPSGGIPTQSPPKKMKKIATSGSSSNKNNDDVRSIAELRQTVVIGQRLSAPVKPGRQPGGGGGGSRSSPKRNSFWT